MPVGTYVVRVLREIEVQRRKEERRASEKRALYSELLHYVQVFRLLHFVSAVRLAVGSHSEANF